MPSLPWRIWSAPDGRPSFWSSALFHSWPALKMSTPCAAAASGGRPYHSSSGLTVRRCSTCDRPVTWLTG